MAVVLSLVVVVVVLSAGVPKSVLVGTVAVVVLSVVAVVMPTAVFVSVGVLLSGTVVIVAVVVLSVTPSDVAGLSDASELESPPAVREEELRLFSNLFSTVCRTGYWGFPV